MGRLIIKKKTSEITSVVSTPKKHPLIEKVEDFNTLRSEILDYMADHSEIIQPLLERFEMYNKALTDIEITIKSLAELPGGLDNEFSRGTAAKTVSYKLEGLSEEVKAMPGVVITKTEVNRDMIDALLKSGSIKEEDVAAARVEKVSSAPVKIPPKLELAFKRSAK